MKQEMEEYEKLLLNFGNVQKPKMPKVDVDAYTDNEYLSTVFDIMKDFGGIEDEYLTLKHLKGD